MGFVHRQMPVDGADDFFVSIGAVYAEYSGVVIFNLGGIGAQAARDDDPAILVDCLSGMACRLSALASSMKPQVFTTTTPASS